MKNLMTITADMGNGEQAYFKVIPAGSIDKFCEDVELITTPQSVVELEKKGCWTIV